MSSTCSFCHHGNPPAAKYCNECGSPLNFKPCSQCGAVNEGAAPGCYKCGALLPDTDIALEHEPDVVPTATLITSEGAVMQDLDLPSFAGSNRISHPRAPLFAPRAEAARLRVSRLILPVVIAATAASAGYVVRGSLAEADNKLPAVSTPEGTRKAPIEAEVPDADRLPGNSPAATQHQDFPKPIRNADPENADPEQRCTEAVAALSLCDTAPQTHGKGKSE